MHIIQKQKVIAPWGHSIASQTANSIHNKVMTPTKCLNKDYMPITEVVF